MKSHFLGLLLFYSICLMFSASKAHAMRVIEIKNKLITMELEGDYVKKDEKYLTIDEEGNTRGVVIIKQVDGDQALAEILKGDADANCIFMAYQEPKKQSRVISSESAPKKKTRRRVSSSQPQQESYSTKGFGFAIGGSQNNMLIKPSGESITMKGNSNKYLLFYQMSLEKNIGVKANLSYLNMTATGTASTTICSNSYVCNINVSYIGFESLVRYSFVRKSNIDLWIGGGLGFLYALDKSSNAVLTSKITTSQTINAALGLDFYFTKSSFIPIEVNYGLFPTTTTSEANQMTVSLGYAWAF